MKTLLISDTHEFHSELKDFVGIDMIVHSGDWTNHIVPSINSNEAITFLEWYNEVPVKYKILICGNHDTSVDAGLINPRDYKNIIYLEHEYVEIEGIKIFGSPYTPRYGSWSFMKDKGKLDPLWAKIPSDLDLLITHGPPKGILDLAYDRDGNLEYCGDKELYNHVERVNPKFHVFGHIHNNMDCYNSGTRTVKGLKTTFINASCVTDRRFNLGLTSKGVIIDL